MDEAHDGAGEEPDYPMDDATVEADDAMKGTSG
jgi:hypothetical protein